MPEINSIKTTTVSQTKRTAGYGLWATSLWPLFCVSCHLEGPQYSGMLYYYPQIIWMRKLRHREVKLLKANPTGSDRARNLAQGCLTLQSIQVSLLSRGWFEVLGTTSLEALLQSCLPNKRGPSRIFPS